MAKSLRGEKKAKVVCPKKQSLQESQVDTQDESIGCSAGDIQDGCGQ